ncbi:MAG: protease inhibitor I42 family protein [Bacteroidia bacterium]|nr:protease inhibitor I42 family protein [Bacteroidia bacterium]
MFKKILIIGLGILLYACNIAEIKNGYPAINTIENGKSFCIILPEDHTKGYNWQLKPDYTKNMVEHVNEVWHGNEKGIYFNFKAVAAGQTTLTFICRKYTDTLDVKRFVVKISDI